MQTKTYASVISGVQAMVGATLETAESNRLQWLINSRARRAYETFDYWPRWLVIGEARHVNGDKVVPSTVSTGGADVDTFLRIHRENPWDLIGTKQWDFNVVEEGARLVNYSFAYNSDAFTISSLTDLGNGVFAGVASGSMGLAAGDTINIEGVTEVDGLDSPNGAKTLISITGPAFSFASETSTFQSYSGLLADATIKIPEVFVTFKSVLDLTYGDGTNTDGTVDFTETTTVPLEWFEYLVRGTYADFLRNEGQHEKAFAEDVAADKFLMEQIRRAEMQQTHPALATRFETHGGTQSR